MPRIHRRGTPQKRLVASKPPQPRRGARASADNAADAQDGDSGGAAGAGIHQEPAEDVENKGVEGDPTIDDASSHDDIVDSDRDEVGDADLIGDPNDINTLRILITTDNHVGFEERDPVRGEDSFLALEEAMGIAVQQQVDFVLLGGDLFHENTPSQRTLARTVDILRSSCMGPGRIQFQVVNSDAIVGRSGYERVNYLDPNYNVRMPVFSIHGNHDDPSAQGGGRESIAAMDILSCANLVNYFGKADTVGKIVVRPVLIKKGTVRLALYGLGAIRDERLHRMFKEGKVTFIRPSADTGMWFNIFVIHQNRVRGRGEKNYIPHTFIPEFMDLVVWGHEHESLVDPVQAEHFHITQPGSTVATSLVVGEAKDKHVAVLQIRIDDNDPRYKLTPVPLTNVRPFFIEEDVSLGAVEDLDKDHHDAASMVSEYLAERVELLLQQAAEEAARVPHRPESLRLPLVRVKVDLCGFPTISNQRFGRAFVDRVANPSEILLFSRRATKKRTVRAGADLEEGEDLLEAALRSAHSKAGSSAVHEIVLAQLKSGREEVLQLFLEDEMTEAVSNYVNKKQTKAIEDFVRKQLAKQQAALKKDGSKYPNRDAVVNQLAEMNKVRSARRHRVMARQLEESGQEVVQQQDGAGGGEEGEGDEADDWEMVGSDDGDAKAAGPGKGKGKGKAKGSGKRRTTTRASRTTRKTRGKAQVASPRAKRAASSATGSAATKRQASRRRSARVPSPGPRSPPARSRKRRRGKHLHEEDDMEDEEDEEGEDDVVEDERDQAWHDDDAGFGAPYVEDGDGGDWESVGSDDAPPLTRATRRAPSSRSARSTQHRGPGSVRTTRSSNRKRSRRGGSPHGTQAHAARTKRARTARSTRSRHVSPESERDSGGHGDVIEVSDSAVESVFSDGGSVVAATATTRGGRATRRHTQRTVVAGNRSTRSGATGGFESDGSEFQDDATVLRALFHEGSRKSSTRRSRRRR